MNEEHPDTFIWCLTNNKSEYGDSLRQQVLRVSGRETQAALGKVAFLPPAPSSGSDTEALSQAMPELAQRATETQENFYLRVSHRFPSIIVPCFQATPESQLPDSFCHSPCPTVCLGRKAGSYG